MVPDLGISSKSLIKTIIYNNYLTLDFISEGPLHLPLVRPSLEFLPLVVELPPPAHAELHLDLSGLKVNSQGYERKPSLTRFPVEALQFPAVQEKLSNPEGFVVHDVAV